MADLGGSKAIYICCDLTEPVYVCVIQAQLLDVVAAQSNFGDLVLIYFNKLHYNPLLKKHIADRHISLHDDTGEAIKFENSNVILT